MAGHACDQDELIDVPKDCVYVTLGSCGVPVLAHTKAQEDFIKMFNNDDELLRDPVKHIEALQFKFGNNLHIHYPGAKDLQMRKYVNNFYSCFLNSMTLNGTLVPEARKSGLHSIGTYTTTKYIKFNDKITDKDIDYLYKDSLYPTIEQIKYVHNLSNETYKDFVWKMLLIFKVDQKTLFKYFPGVYYNFSCRSVCSYENPDFYNVRRQQSFEGNEVERLSFYKPIDITEESIHFYLSNNNLNLKKAKELIEAGGYDLNEKNHDGNTLLFICCSKGYLELAQLLINKGALMDKHDYQECLKSKKLYQYLVSTYADKHLEDRMQYLKDKANLRSGNK
jgi:hypothetical protein